jgi:hypothetical protein
MKNFIWWAYPQFPKDKCVSHQNNVKLSRDTSFLLFFMYHHDNSKEKFLLSLDTWQLTWVMRNEWWGGLIPEKHYPGWFSILSQSLFILPWIPCSPLAYMVIFHSYHIFVHIGTVNVSVPMCLILLKSWDILPLIFRKSILVQSHVTYQFYLQKSSKNISPTPRLQFLWN